MTTSSAYPMSELRPVTILISALGGEGGGVMTDWILSACRAEGLTVQATSVPGVAQRTGATTYYLEILREKLPAGAAEPVMALYPQVGDIDLMVATELVEAGRACQSGFVSPDRTALIASMHRFYLIDEKIGMGDTRLETARVEATVRGLSKRVILGDFAQAARDSGTVINAVLIGAIAGTGILPLPVEAFERAIREEGKSVDANLRGFQYGLKIARGEIVELRPAPRAAIPAPVPTSTAVLESLRDRVVRDFPTIAQEIVNEGAARTFDYQDQAYATLYLDRLDTVWAAERAAGGDGSGTAETGRHLALWMTYEDVIRVAQIKTRANRLQKVQRGSGAKGEQPVIVTEFLKPGIDEFASLLPPSLGRRLVGWAERANRHNSFNVGLHIRTSTVLGFALLRLMALLKGWRRRGYRFGVEQQSIERWLEAIRQAMAKDRLVAREIAECARLIKGYSDTHRRGTANFRRIMDMLVAPTLTASNARPDFYANAAAAIATARKAALSDPEGQTLDRTLAQLVSARA
jgi:indolepyruvate ferredoxin oxidoreductase beta subunit